ncbi:GNAT family acetyltransferase [Demequina activiva]|uniref:Acetyltransferase n=1 Tax=Demequina activiva TaxID=1582364 RepID=A0A919UHI7_9MICO|nr:GNAT family acetyltransferase [Demequina activiva]GIG55494.1 acetyltransferase [Demequina activiva]
MTTVIRRFDVADTDAVASLWAEVFADDPPRNEPRGMIARKLARDPELFWVADEPGTGVVGALMAGYDGVRGWLYHLAVAPGRRRQGIASALVEHAVSELHALGCRKVNLQVRASNVAVAALYASLGWTEDESISLGRVLPD